MKGISHVYNFFIEDMMDMSHVYKSALVIMKKKKTYLALKLSQTLSILQFDYTVSFMIPLYLNNKIS